MDVKNLEFDNDSFDLIFDKACLDSIFCGENSFENSEKTLKEMHRVLKTGGSYILITNTK